MKICAVILAAGSGRRMDMDTNKVFLKFDEQSAVMRCIKAFEQTALFSGLVVVCKPQEREIMETKIKKHCKHPGVRVCEGGAERQDSVRNALMMLDEDTDVVAVHDAARCFVTQKIIQDCVSSAIRYGSGVAAMAATDTIKRAKNGVVLETLDRSELVCVQTPQTFTYDLLCKAYTQAEADGFLGTDDASLVERLGAPVRLVSGSPDNIKLTTRSDVQKGREIVQRDSALRIGNGFDMHAFATGRRLVLGGVEIPSEIGLDGHSDADVLIHAIMDALLGAARLGDIGELFPPTDMRYKDIYSIELLREVGDLLKKYGYRIINIDSTLIMQRPKVAAYRQEMIGNIAAALNMNREYINVKATTTEHLGSVGRGEGAAAQAVCILQRNG